VSGLAVLALGIWMKVSLHVYVELTTVYYDSAAYILIAVGCVIVLVGSLGCLCTVKGFTALLYLVSPLGGDPELSILCDPVEPSPSAD